MRILWLIVVALLVVWLIGALVNLVGAVIHALLVAAILVAVYAYLRRNAG